MHDKTFTAWTLPNSVATDHQNPINTGVHASQTVKPLHVLEAQEAVVVPLLRSCLMSCQMATPSDHAQMLAANTKHTPARTLTVRFWNTLLTDSTAFPLKRLTGCANSSVVARSVALVRRACISAKSQQRVQHAQR